MNTRFELGVYAVSHVIEDHVFDTHSAESGARIILEDLARKPALAQAVINALMSEEVREDLASLAGITCQCDSAWTDRGRHEPLHGCLSDELRLSDETKAFLLALKDRK